MTTLSSKKNFAAILYQETIFTLAEGRDFKELNSRYNLLKDGASDAYNAIKKFQNDVK